MFTVYSTTYSLQYYYSLHLTVLPTVRS